MNRLKKIAEHGESVQKLMGISTSELKSFVESKLKQLVSDDDIYDYAVKHDINVADVDLIDLINDMGFISDIWERIQEEYEVFDNPNYLTLDDGVKSAIADLIGSIDLDTTLQNAVRGAEEQEVNSEEKDPWNQNNFI